MPARVAELADATDLKSVGLTSVPVRVRPRAPQGAQHVVAQCKLNTAEWSSW